MNSDIPHFQIPLNLPHAGRIAGRIVSLLDREGVPAAGVEKTADKLVAILQPYADSDENPRPDLAARVRDQAAVLGRQLVDQIEAGRLGHDRLGQCVRNLFECLELGREGAILSLRAGEDPASFQRPV
ncbi:MAG: hypothetical protein JWM88_2143 [Verrucomicrobia bacterium]|nr:hypothetical protein [Verrucomicrobiota bacterium]